MGRVLRVAVVILSALSLQLFAQQPKVLAPHRRIPKAVPDAQRRPIPPGKQGSMIGGIWMTDANFKSSLNLRNVVETSAGTVAPVLHLSNRAKYSLPPVPAILQNVLCHALARISC